ncbi:hypothetical protein [Thalassovita mediterranea]|jgi:hypothetical protein|uniref:hypothetical protein n=1 Tax=Thalassovita mediterranea TaxID=340021 RepID=UPI00071D629B|nr:hypothetical protein [Thalassovita mediterranea]SIS32406.1 hypothetical protein SAMN05421685_106159 [Thalassovita mediterranea]
MPFYKIAFCGLLLQSTFSLAQAQVNIQNYEIEGNLASTQDLGCITLREAPSNQSPADLAVSVLDCYAIGKDTMAAELMSLMLIRGRFDILRVTDKSAHQAISVLMLQLRQAGGPQWESRMGPSFNDLSKHRDAHCQELRTLGTPTHSPDYMIKHGMGAFTKPDDDVIRSDFDADKAWDDVLVSYVKCPLVSD